MRVPKAVVDRIRSTVVMDEVIEAVGLGPVPPTRKIRSLSNPDERTPSLHVYEDGWWDFSTGTGGSQIDFVMAFFGCSFPKAVQFLQGRAKLTARRIVPARRQWQDLTEVFYAEPEGNVADFARLDDWADRKWPTASLVTIFNLGSRLTANSELWTPHTHPSNPATIVGVKIRNLIHGGKRSVSGSTFTLGPYNPLHKCDGSRLYVVEGESDYWCMVPFLRPDESMVALPSGAGTWRAEWFRPYVASEVVVILDGDDAGQATAERLVEFFGSCSRSVVPDGGRLAEALGEGWLPGDET